MRRASESAPCHVQRDPVKPSPHPAIAETSPAESDHPVNVAKLFREHNTALLRFTAAKLGSEHEAREVAQEAYVRLLQLDKPETISYLRAFLFKTASNLAVDRLRARRRAPSLHSTTDEDIAAFELSPERQCAGEQMIAVLNRALDELPTKCRRIFVLYRVEELSRAEIAIRMGLGERMVRLYMARALEHLRRRIDEASEGRRVVP
jgi:RNA polymerase sigma factor (sigma-70 family)